MGRGDVVKTVIAQDTAFVGDLESSGSIRVDGRYEGVLTAGGDLIIGENGHVQGKVCAKNITVAGKLLGEIEARGKLELVPTAYVQGEAQMMFLVVEEGAFFQGRCEPVSRDDLKERGKTLQIETPGE